MRYYRWFSRLHLWISCLITNNRECETMTKRAVFNAKCKQIILFPFFHLDTKYECIHDLYRMKPPNWGYFGTQTFTHTNLFSYVKFLFISVVMAAMVMNVVVFVAFNAIFIENDFDSTNPGFHSLHLIQSWTLMAGNDIENKQLLWNPRKPMFISYKMTV